jgi:hypothetical protein
MTSTAPQIANNAAGIRGLGPQADFFTLSSTRSPGIARLMSCNAAQAWDVKKGYGLNWATVVPMGEELTKLVFRIEIWTAEQSALWDTFAATYLSRPVPPPSGTNDPRSFGFSHEEASGPPFNVVSVVVLDVRWLGPTEDNMKVYEVELLEWRKPVAAPGSVNTSTPAVEQPMPTAQTKQEQEQNGATQQLLSLDVIDSQL